MRQRLSACAVVLAAMLGLGIPVAIAAPPAPVACPDCYVPAPATSFQVQLQGDKIDTTVEADLFAVDWQVSPQVVADLKARGRRVFCYISVGSWEDYRPDKRRFPARVLGDEYGGYPDERWLDIRRVGVLEPIMTARMARCQRMGVDGVWFDNVDGFSEPDGTGFRISSDQQLTYNATLANDAHQMGLSAAFNNDPKQAAQMVAYFDWVLYELGRDDVRSCFYNSSCQRLQPFHDAGKATFILEYKRSRMAAFCGMAVSRGFNGIVKKLDLTAFRAPCPPPA